jgi:CBS domain containing-hemolysin-like protein
MDPDTSSTQLVLILVLLAVNAFCVAAEFSLIAARRTRIDQLAREGDAGARRALPRLAHADQLALVAQLGSSAASLLLGYVVTSALIPWFIHGISLPGGAGLAPWAAAVVALTLVACAHLVLAEQVPKIVGTHRAEFVAIRLALPVLEFLSWPLRPVIWALSSAVRGVVRLVGIAAPGYHPLVHTPEEIRLLVAHSHEQGVVEEDEREMIHGVFEFSETVAREVMTPRTDIVAIPVECTLDDLVEAAVQEGHSRIPVYEGSIDSIVGIVLVKDLLPLAMRAGRDEDRGFDVRSIMREPYFVPDTKPVDDILAEFRQQGLHIAVVLDEFGGTYGVVTLEDLLEEIVGEINDEYDVAEPAFSSTPEGDVLIDGGTAISEVNERFGTALPESDFDTIAGFVFGALGRVPALGDVVAVPGSDGALQLQVEEVDERRIACLRLTRTAPALDRQAQES